MLIISVFVLLKVICYFLFKVLDCFVFLIIGREGVFIFLDVLFIVGLGSIVIGWIKFGGFLIGV